MLVHFFHGGRCAALLTRRSMLAGTDHCPTKLPPQLWLDVLQRIRPRVTKHSRVAGVECPDLDHRIVENCACCFSKVVDHLLGCCSHALYR